MRILEFSDGWTTETPPTNTGNAAILPAASEAAFVTAKGSAAAAGDLFLDTTVNSLKFYEDGSWHTVTTLALAQTLTNKTLTAPIITSAVIDVIDSSFLIKDNSDATKVVKFECSGVATGTTRTITVPDANLTLVGTATTQTLTGKTLTSPVVNGLFLSASAKTGAYSLTASDDFITGDSDSAAFTLTLPDCASNAGKVFRIKKVGTVFATANALTVARGGSDTIFDTVSGLTSTALHTPGEEIEIISLGSTVWHIISRRIPSTSVSFTPTGDWNTNVNYTGFWQRVGNKMHVDISISVSDNPNSSSLTVSLPSGVTIDTGKLAAGSGVQSFGTCTQSRYGVRTTLGLLMYESTTSVRFRYLNSSSPTELSSVTQSAPDTFDTGDILNAKFIVPITGWNG